jgi:hypothetical protein
MTDNEVLVRVEYTNQYACQDCAEMLSTPIHNMVSITRRLRHYRYNTTVEAELQEAIARVLTEGEIPFQREFQLSAKDRIDFIVADVGIEVKIGSTYAQVIRQLHRYAQFGEVQGLVLVTTKATHTLPDFISQKPLMLLNLSIGGAF